MPLPSFFSDSEQNRWHSIRGWLLPEAAELLYRYAKESPPEGQVVEIGSFAGKSSVCIGQAIKGKKQPMTCIDLRFQTDFRKNLADFGADVFARLLEGPSLDHFENWDAPISFLYIDGNHDKGYAMADLIVWDMFVLPGGYVALDDTGGFMIGPNMQVQAMTTSGAYEFLEERGGISFLRKNHNLSPLICHATTAPMWFAKLHVASSHLGAMDPLCRQPRFPHQPKPFLVWIDRFWNTSPAETLKLIQRKINGFSRILKSRDEKSLAGIVQVSSSKAGIDWLRENHQVIANALPTLDYLDACRVMREENYEKASILFTKLMETPAEIMLLHYRLSLAGLCKLRLAQCLDLAGRRKEAAKLFAEIEHQDTDTLLREAARPWITEKFVIPSSGNLLLREYNLAWQERKIQKP